MSDYILHIEDGTVLCHHGVKGMKWGIRRYQNKDGTLTNKGRKRAGLSSSRKLFSFKKSSDKTESKKPAKRKLKDLSDDELRARVNRIKLEQEYKDLVKPKKTKDRSVLFKSVGKDIYQKFLLPAGQDVAKNLVAPYIVNKLGTMINKKVGIEIIDTTYARPKNEQPQNKQPQPQPQNKQSKPQPQNKQSKPQNEQSKPQPQNEQSKPQPKPRNSDPESKNPYDDLPSWAYPYSREEQFINRQSEKKRIKKNEEQSETNKSNLDDELSSFLDKLFNSERKK